MEMDFEKRRKEIIQQLEDIREQLMNSLEILEKFKARKVQEGKARAKAMDKLVHQENKNEKPFKINGVSLN